MASERTVERPRPELSAARLPAGVAAAFRYSCGGRAALGGGAGARIPEGSR